MIEIRRPIPATQIKLILWDLDGTLVDSELDLAHSINAMLRHLERPELPIEVVASYIGDGAPMLVRRALGDPQDEEFCAERAGVLHGLLSRAQTGQHLRLSRGDGNAAGDSRAQQDADGSADQ